MLQIKDNMRKYKEIVGFTFKKIDKPKRDGNGSNKIKLNNRVINVSFMHQS